MGGEKEISQCSACLCTWEDTVLDIFFEVLFLNPADGINSNISKLWQIFKQVRNYKVFMVFLLHLEDKTKEY